MEILGIDVSWYQSGEWTAPDGSIYTRYFDPEEASLKGVNFAFIKASEGLYKDRAVDHFAKAFSDAGIPFGFYHFPRAEYSYLKQVDFFYDVIKDFDYDLPPVLDFEKHPNGTAPGLSFCQAFLGRIGTKTGKTPILYTAPYFWKDLIGSDKATWAKAYPLWMAHYYNTDSHPELKFPVRSIPDTVSSSTTMPYLPAPFEKWSFWQFSDVGDGEYYGGNYDIRINKTGLDLNIYRGCLMDMYAEFGIGQDVPDLPPVPQDKYVRVVNCQWLSFRSRPETYPGDRPAIGVGVRAKILDEQDGWLYVELSGGDKGWIWGEYTIAD